MKTYQINGKKFTTAEVTSRRLLKVAKVFGAKTLTEVATMFAGLEDEVKKSFDVILLDVMTDDQKVQALLEAMFVEPVTVEDAMACGDVEMLTGIITDFFTDSSANLKKQAKSAHP
jgi:hypothetical protein